MFRNFSGCLARLAAAADRRKQDDVLKKCQLVKEYFFSQTLTKEHHMRRRKLGGFLKQVNLIKIAVPNGLSRPRLLKSNRFLCVCAQPASGDAKYFSHALTKPKGHACMSGQADCGGQAGCAGQTPEPIAGSNDQAKSDMKSQGDVCQGCPSEHMSPNNFYHHCPLCPPKGFDFVPPPKEKCSVFDGSTRKKVTACSSTIENPPPPRQPSPTAEKKSTCTEPVKKDSFCTKPAGPKRVPEGICKRSQSVNNLPPNPEKLAKGKSKDPIRSFLERVFGPKPCKPDDKMAQQKKKGPICCKKTPPAKETKCYPPCQKEEKPPPPKPEPCDKKKQLPQPPVKCPYKTDSKCKMSTMAGIRESVVIDNSAHRGIHSTVVMANEECQPKKPPVEKDECCVDPVKEDPCKNVVGQKPPYENECVCHHTKNFHRDLIVTTWNERMRQTMGPHRPRGAFTAGFPDSGLCKYEWNTAIDKKYTDLCSEQEPLVRPRSSRSSPVVIHPCMPRASSPPWTRKLRAAPPP